jgi:hypothetical protein
MDFYIGSCWNIFDYLVRKIRNKNKENRILYKISPIEKGNNY